MTEYNGALVAEQPREWQDYAVEYGKKALPYLSTIGAMLFPQITWLPVVLSAIPKLVAEAEGLFDDGTDKMEHVLSGAEIVADTMIDVSTGGQKETWISIKPMIKEATEIIVAGSNFAEQAIEQFNINKTQAGA